MQLYFLPWFEHFWRSKEKCCTDDGAFNSVTWCVDLTPVARIKRNSQCQNTNINYSLVCKLPPSPKRTWAWKCLVWRATRKYYSACRICSVLLWVIKSATLNSRQIHHLLGTLTRSMCQLSHSSTTRARSPQQRLQLSLRTPHPVARRPTGTSQQKRAALTTTTTTTTRTGVWARPLTIIPTYYTRQQGDLFAKTNINLVGVCLSEVLNTAEERLFAKWLSALLKF